MQETERKLETVQHRLNTHEKARPWPGPASMNTPAYDAWLKIRDGLRKERDELYQQIEAEKKRIATKPFAPLPPGDEEPDANQVAKAITGKVAGVTEADYVAEISLLKEVLHEAGVVITEDGPEAIFWKPDGDREWLPLAECVARRRKWAAEHEEMRKLLAEASKPVGFLVRETKNEVDAANLADLLRRITAVVGEDTKEKSDGESEDADGVREAAPATEEPEEKEDGAAGTQG